jgi:PKD repeat protein
LNLKLLKFSLFTSALILVFVFAKGAIGSFGGEFLSSKLANVNDPDITGPDRLCIQFGSVIGEFSGGGNAVTDVYDWKIIDASGKEIFGKQGGFQTISATFKDPGIYRIELIVSRASVPFPKKTKNITVQPAPTVRLNPSYQLCGTDPLELNAIDPTTPTLALFKFEWKNSTGTVIGNSNNLIVTAPGTYTVDFFSQSAAGLQDCFRSLSTTIIDSSIFDIVAEGNTICPNKSLLFSTEPNITGNWYVQKIGEPSRKFVSSGSSITINPLVTLEGPGDYNVIFEVINPDVPGCVIPKSQPLNYSLLPDFEILNPKGASDCNVADGAIRIRALTFIDYIFVEETEIFIPSLAPGDIFDIPSESGAFNLISYLGSCSNSYAAVVPLAITPPELEYDLIDITGESCTNTGKELGGFIIKFINGPSDGLYRVLNEKGETAKSESFFNKSEIPVSIPGGTFFVEVLNLDECSVPKIDEITILSKNQVQFSIPAEIFICQSFDLVPETTQDLDFTLISPDGTKETKPAGEPLTVQQAGLHQMVGIPNAASDLCPTLTEFLVTLVDPVDFEPKLVQEDCFGNRTYEAEIFGRDPNDLLFKWFNEKDEIVSEGIQLIPISTGLFKLDVQTKNSEACPIPPIEFFIAAPVLEVDVSLESTKFCELQPFSVITLETTFPEEVTDIYWRRFTESGDIIPLVDFKDKWEITVDAPGIYEATVFSFLPEIGKVGPTGRGCELGRKSIEVDVTPDRISFDIPSALSICESYNFSPSTSQNLSYTVTYPSGEMVTKTSAQTFLLNQNGTYTFFGFNPDPLSLLCPDEQTMEVTINRKIEFEPVLISESCEGIKTYQAVLTGTDPSEADFSWLDDQGIEIGNEEFLILDDFGSFALDVQPKGSLPCDQAVKVFEAPRPILNVSVILNQEPFCPDSPYTALAVTTDFNSFDRLEWWFTNISGVESQLTSELNKPEILAVVEGTYEARAINKFDCLLGFDRVLILRSTDLVRPIVEETYQICPRYEIAPQINPGSFASYEWYFDDNLVSSSPTHKPNQIGTYKLIVFSSEGCAYETTFVTEEECELKAVFPNAIQPGNPDKPFLIYTNYLIDDLEIWVFSKWGEVIFQCKNSGLLNEESTCLWDGYYRGEKLPPGSYAYRMNFRNNEKNITKEQMGSILVID